MPETPPTDKRDLRYLAQRAYRIMLADLSRGEEEFERLLRIYPEAGQLYLERAEGYRHLGHLAMARDDYEQAMDLIPLSSMRERAANGFQLCATAIGTRANKDASIVKPTASAPAVAPHVHFRAGLSLVDKYVLDALIGQGSMASVWAAHEPDMHDRKVAIKVPREDLLPFQGNEMNARYARELQVCAELEAVQAPAIVRALTTERLNGRILLVMEYMPGGSLGDLLEQRKRPLPHSRAIAITRRVLMALQAAHEHPLRIVHRDVKPSNILFDANGDAHLGDFGLAQFGRASETEGSPGLLRAGTPLYVAPEQLSGDGIVSPSADLYAVGVVLFEMLTLQLYKEHPPGTRPGQLVTGIAPTLDGLVARCLSSDPWKRPQTAQELLQILNSLQEDVLPSTFKEPQVTENENMQEKEPEAMEPDEIDDQTPEVEGLDAPDDLSEPEMSESIPDDEIAPVQADRTRDPLGTATWEPLDEVRPKKRPWRWVGTIFLILCLAFLALWETNMLSWAGITSPFAQPTAAPTATVKPTTAPTQVIVVSSPVPTFTPLVTATPKPTATLVPTNTPEPTPTEEPTVTPGPTIVFGLSAGDQALIAGTGGRGANLRTGPGLSYAVSYSEEEGMAVTVLEGPVYADNYAWINVELERGGTGWIAGRFLAAPAE